MLSGKAGGMRKGEEQSCQRGQERRRHRDEGEAPPDRNDSDGSQRFAKRARTDSDNGEAPFVWRKKVEMLRKKGINAEEAQERQRAELQDELVAAKRRREQREQEREEREAEQVQIAREKEAQMNEGWHKNEASFHGKQHFVRQAIRIGENRPVGIDLFAKYVRLDVHSDVTVLHMDNFLEGLGVARVQKLADGVEDELDYVVDFDSGEDNAVWNRGIRLEFWQCVRVCVQERLERLRASGEEGVLNAVGSDVERLLQGKSISKLREMETEIDMRLKHGGHGGDSADATLAEVDFWQAALGKIQARVASMRLKELSEMLWMERQQREEKRPRKEDRTTGRREKKKGGQGRGDNERLGDDGVASGLGGEEEEEEEFKDEVEAPKRSGSWYNWGNDKYRARKPKYVNKVLSGYRWTKYNRTHYDHDNPPPKTVQGYMFNILYPDLMDASQTPWFTISKTERAEVVIITFHAGPPYQDIAFKIVNGRWVTSHRRGYRCSFDKGVLQLWFKFDRYYYRR
ncbi:unnamed protein product [Agarophyton chilense]